MITSTDRRGAEVFAVELERALIDLGHRVRTFALARGTSNHSLDVPVLGPAPLAIATLRTLRAEARSAEVVIGHGSRTLPACALSLTGTRTPFVYRNIGDPTYWSGHGLRRLRTTTFLGRARAVVALTSRTADTLHDHYRVGRDRLAVIPTAASRTRNRPATAEERSTARRNYGLPDGAPVAAVIGALSPEKAVDVAIDALAHLPELRLVVAGDGPERASLESRAARVAPARVKFTGALDDPSPAFAAADVVVLPSRTEGLPGVLIEAGLRGLACVATDVGYVRDIVIDGETGVVVAGEDSGALARGIERVLAEDAAPGMGMGAAARTRCLDRFELEPIAKQWSELLAGCREVVGNDTNRVQVRGVRWALARADGPRSRQRLSAGVSWRGLMLSPGPLRQRRRQRRSGDGLGRP